MKTTQQCNSRAVPPTALEERLTRIAHEEAMELQLKRCQVATDRLLARLFQHGQTGRIFKGGYAMERRFHTARATKDLPFNVRAKPAALLEYLQNSRPPEAGGSFRFRFGEAKMDLDGVPCGGARNPVPTALGGRAIAKFHLDAGVGDVFVEPVEFVRARDRLGFAGVAPPDAPMIQRERQFAEKLHADTSPRPAKPNRRVRDLVDIVLLIRFGTLDATCVVECLRRTVARRDTHPIPRFLEAPPESGTTPFAALAGECALEISVSFHDGSEGCVFDSLRRKSAGQVVFRMSEES